MIILTLNDGKLAEPVQQSMLVLVEDQNDSMKWHFSCFQVFNFQGHLNNARILTLIYRYSRIPALPINTQSARKQPSSASACKINSNRLGRGTIRSGMYNDRQNISKISSHKKKTMTLHELKLALSYKKYVLIAQNKCSRSAISRYKV